MTGVDDADARGIVGERRDALADYAENPGPNQGRHELAWHWAYPQGRRFDGERLPSQKLQSDLAVERA